jgi:DsbC/DsbD-like thiol-disulfide interchange protein/cytochrome c biogenesis protein CcdA
MLRRLFLLLMLCAATAAAAFPGTVRGQHHSARLLFEGATIAPGRPLTAAFVITPDPGWHIYWQNPGESGYAPSVRWTAAGDLAAGPLLHPLPRRLVLGGISSNVHEGETILLEELRLGAKASAGPLRPVADLDLLVCSATTCVPDGTRLAGDLSVGDGAPDPRQAPLFARARAALPRAAGHGALYQAGPGRVRIFLPGVGLAAGEHAHLFGTAPGLLADGGRQEFASVPGGLLATVAAGTSPPTAGFGLVLGIESRNGAARGIGFSAVPSKALPEGPAPSAAPDPAGFLIAFGGALLGGLVLNLMPCVFPILSLKAMSLVRSGGDDRAARVEALGYSLGAIGVILALGAGLIALRSGGQAMGWAFQLQDPRIVGLLLLLVTAIATNMAGLFELPSLSVTAADDGGFAGAVGTGALAAFIATPCTGPFMAGALGAALLLPTPAALAIFFGLGLGLSLPFLLIGFWKPARRLLPRPGAWMVTLRRLLSLPMFATAAGLAWIVGREAGVDAMAVAVAAALLLGLGLWQLGRRQLAGRTGWPAAMPLAAAALLVAAMAGVPTPSAPVRADARGAAHAAAGAEAFSPARLQALRAAGRPVFVYMTADWCLSCKVNEVSLRSAAVADSFARAGVVVLRGDWTNGDPAITAFLKARGSAGVPLYVWYPPAGPERQLPQILTPALLTDLGRSI